MRLLVPTEKAVGMFLAEDLKDSQGRVLLASGVSITARYAERLLAMGWLEVVVQGPSLGEDRGTAVVNEATEQRAITALSKAFSSYRNERWLNTAALRTVVDQIINLLRRNGPVLYHLEALHSYDTHVFHHCTNVSAVSTLIGLALGLDRRELPDLGLAGFLHDIGKVRVPSNILNKPGELTPDELQVIRQHPTWGAEVAREARLDSPVILTIQQHHERIDGGGYPVGARGQEITPFARIVSVADSFCAMTADHLYRRRLPPQEAVDNIRTDNGYDRDALAALLRSVALYPNGSFVRLAGWRLAVVLRQTRDPFLPILRLLTNPDGTPLQGKPVRLNPDLPGGPNAILDMVPPDTAMEELTPRG